MDDDVADDNIDVHWQHLVNRIKVGAFDGHLEDVYDAEHRRDPPRKPVLAALERRMESSPRETSAGESTREETDP